MARQPKDVTSLSERLKSAELLMRPNVSKKLTMEDLEALALFITKAQALFNVLGKTLNIKQPNVATNYNSNVYTNNSASAIPYQQQIAPINNGVNGSGTVPGHNPNAMGFGSMGDVTLYNPELDFINQQQIDVPIFVPSEEQLEAEAKLLNSAFTLPEDIVIQSTNDVT
jgi:hypothetical protein